MTAETPGGAAPARAAVDGPREGPGRGSGGRRRSPEVPARGRTGGPWAGEKRQEGNATREGGAGPARIEVFGPRRGAGPRSRGCPSGRARRRTEPPRCRTEGAIRRGGTERRAHRKEQGFEGSGTPGARPVETGPGRLHRDEAARVVETAEAEPPAGVAAHGDRTRIGVRRKRRRKVRRRERDRWRTVALKGPSSGNLQGGAPGARESTPAGDRPRRPPGPQSEPGSRRRGGRCRRYGIRL